MYKSLPIDVDALQFTNIWRPSAVTGWRMPLPSGNVATTSKSPGAAGAAPTCADRLLDWLNVIDSGDNAAAPGGSVCSGIVYAGAPCRKAPPVPVTTSDNKAAFPTR